MAARKANNYFLIYSKGPQAMPAVLLYSRASARAVFFSPFR